jgi:Family of unknown function (DUF5681)
MSAASDDFRVGYGRPPQAHQWKKGQSGNPRRRKRKAPESTVAMIDRLLAAPVPITVNGEIMSVPAIEAIVLQLMQKEMAGSAPAARALLKYREFANQNGEKRLQVIFVESDYTKALSAQSVAPGGGRD